MDRQHELPFALAEGSQQERRSLLIAAFRRVTDENGRKCLRLAHKYVLERIFHITAGGTPGQNVKRTHAQIASDWLECHEDTARKTMQDLESSGLITTTTVLTQNGREANSYTIHWPGVYSVLGIAPTPTIPPENSPKSQTRKTPEPDPKTSGLRESQTRSLRGCSPELYGGAPPKTSGLHKGIDASCCSLMPLVVDDGVEREISSRWDDISGLAKRALAVAWPDQTADVDARRLVLSAAIIAVMRVNEEWLLGAARITRVSAKTNPRAFLRRTLANRLAETEGLCRAEEADGILSDLIAEVRPIVSKIVGHKRTLQTTEP